MKVALSPERRAELKKLAEKIDREEGPAIRAWGGRAAALDKRLAEIVAELRIERERRDLSPEDIAARAYVEAEAVRRAEETPHLATLPDLTEYAHAVGRTLEVRLAD